MIRSGPWQLWVGLAIIIAAVATPIIVGTIILRIYRHYKPLKPSELTGLAAIGTEEKDGFFKTLVIGCVVCAPIYAFLYLTYG